MWPNPQKTPCFMQCSWYIRIQYFKGPLLRHVIYLKIQFSKLKISIHLFIHLFIHECAKFCGSRTIMGLVNLVPSCLRGSKIHSRGYFVGPKFFLVGILWVRIFFVWVFRGFKIFFSLVFHGSRFFSRGHFVVTRERKWGIETSKCHTPQPINME